MALDFLAVVEVHAAHRAPPVLCRGPPLIPSGHGEPRDLLPRPPVVPQAGVVRGGRPTHHGVSLDLGPAEFEQVLARALVAKHPMVVPLLVQFTEVPGDAPLHWLPRVRVLEVTHLAVV